MNAQTIKIPKITVSGYKDRSRTSMGFNVGTITNDWESKKLAHDRDVEFSIDPMDIDETNLTLAVLGATGLFMNKISYVSQAKTPIYNGDILVTKTKGHIVVVVSGHPRSQTQNSGSGSNVAKGEYNMQTIRKGSKGKAVKIWQVILGHTGSKIDGIFGSGTEADTRIWQKAHGLTADGIVGTKSWKAGLESA